MEIWKVCHVSNDYEVSNTGRIRRRTNSRLRKAGYELAKRDFRGHWTVSLWLDKRVRHFYVHALVCSAFNGPRPKGYLCRHRNGDGYDNNPSNLVWGTHKENRQDDVLHGVNKGENNCKAKLTTPQVIEIRAKLKMGERTQAIANIYGVHISSVQRIQSGRAWTHI